MNNVIAKINGNNVSVGTVNGDEWWTTPNFRSTPIPAFDLSETAIREAQKLGAKWVHISHPGASSVDGGFVLIEDVIKSGVHFTVETERFIYCPVVWIKAEKWEQACLPIM